jgi:hypothetical protein
VLSVIALVENASCQSVPAVKPVFFPIINLRQFGFDGWSGGFCIISNQATVDT